MLHIWIALLISTVCQATENDKSHQPKPFPYQNDQAVFVDFTRADYDISYDLNSEKARVVADIDFDIMQPGFPIFDLVSEPESIELDGQTLSATLTKTPDGATTLRVINQKLVSGSHHLKITAPITELVDFRSDGVKSAFWTSDLDERNFLERYLPANFEFDQVQMNFNIHFKGKTPHQLIYTNGVIESTDERNYRIHFPDYFTASSMFFHTVPQGYTDEVRFELHSLDGRTLPAVIYIAKKNNSGNLDRIKDRLIAIFNELENDYGAFPHPSVTVYLAGAGGMEYCGATMTDVSSMGHELFHSYFARGLMPANGNSGWLDEALASWRDDHYETVTSLNGTSIMSSHPTYTRITDDAAYSFGERFMAFLNHKTEKKGGLKPFMKRMIETRKFQPIFVSDFIKEMNNFYQSSFDSLFKRYTFGESNRFEFPVSKKSAKEIHHKMNPSELRPLL
jgi:hypothetical protein